MKLANVKNQEYTKEMFKDIAFFTLAEPGAMGSQSYGIYHSRR